VFDILEEIFKNTGNTEKYWTESSSLSIFL